MNQKLNFLALSANALLFAWLSAGCGDSGNSKDVPPTGGDTGNIIDEDAGSDTGTDIAIDLTGPCDIYEAAGTPCVAAYSMVRRIYSAYSGPLYQVRSDSNA